MFMDVWTQSVLWLLELFSFMQKIPFVKFARVSGYVMADLIFIGTVNMFSGFEGR